MGKALQQNRALRTFAFSESDSMGDTTGVALASALRQNRTLQRFALSSFYSGGCVSETALDEALCANFTILAFDVGVPFPSSQLSRRKRLLKRNAELLGTWQALAWLSRGVLSMGFRSLAELNFRNEIFSFFVPSTHAATVRSFATAGPLISVTGSRSVGGIDAVRALAS